MVALTLFPGDSVVALVLGAVALGVLAGKAAGGVRMGFVLVATFIALIAQGHLSQLQPVRDVAGLFSFQNALWHWFMPKVVAFVAVGVLLVLVGEVFHKKIVLHFKYKHKGDDRYFESWEYMNMITGLALGVVAALIYLLSLFTLIHPAGYLLVQVHPESKLLRAEPRTDRYARRVYYDMLALGLDKTTAWLSSARPRYYEGADVVGFIYNNAVRSNQMDSARFRTRIFAYPGMGDALRNSSFQALRDDTNLQFRVLLGSQTNFTRILSHPQVRGLVKEALSNPGSTNSLAHSLGAMDLKDYLKFLREGQSAVYHHNNPAMPAVVGVWQLDIAATHELFRRKYPRGREPVHHALLGFLHKISYMMREARKGQYYREYDWTLAFYRDGKTNSGRVEISGRHLPVLPLFDRGLAGVAAPPGADFNIFREPGLLPERQLVAEGQWTMREDKSRYIVDFKARPPYSRLAHAGVLQIVFSRAEGGRLRAEIPSCDNEAFVFERYQY